MVSFQLTNQSKQKNYEGTYKSLASPSVKVPFRDFKKAISVSTINKNLSGCAYFRKECLAEITNIQLIQEWRYSQIANTYCRYPSLFKPYKIKIHHQRLQQLGSENYLKILSEVLQQRNLLDIADNSFSLSFVTTKHYKE